jgi:hypothetical protein
LLTKTVVWHWVIIIHRPVWLRPPQLSAHRFVKLLAVKLRELPLAAADPVHGHRYCLPACSRLARVVHQDNRSHVRAHAVGSSRRRFCRKVALGLRDSQITTVEAENLEFSCVRPFSTAAIVPI